MAKTSFAKGLQVTASPSLRVDSTSLPTDVLAQGVLTKYGSGNAHTAFISGCVPRSQALIYSVPRVRPIDFMLLGQEDKHVVLVGGLGDGLMLAP